MKRKYYLYVIALKETAFKDKKCIAQNPEFVKGPYSRCYYVGASSDTPEIRYEKHITDYKMENGIGISSRVVRKHGYKKNGLRPRQYKGLNPIYAKNFKEAEIYEITLAEELRKNGHFVYQN